MYTHLVRRLGGELMTADTSVIAAWTGLAVTELRFKIALLINPREERAAAVWMKSLLRS
jgi:hypothetical protein